MSTQRQPSFITEVRTGDSGGNGYKKSTLDIKVRTDYAKLQEVVEHFAKKVDQLVDKQRSEYVQAYEYHMSDVQRELYNLREKATAIANDTTREEKIKKLDSDQKWFRNEAMRLDVETNEYRKKMRNTKVMIQSTERERDWLLEKLRSAKEKYRHFKRVRGELQDHYGLDGGSLSLGDSDSSYTLELQHNRAHSASDGVAWRNQLQNDYMVTRQIPAAQSISKATPKSSATPLSPLKFAKHKEQVERRQLLSKLVTARAKQDGIRDLLSQCANCALTGAWSKHRRRPFLDVLEECQLLIGVDGDKDSAQKRLALARELATHPQLYFLLSDVTQGIVGGATEPQISSHNEAHHENEDQLSPVDDNNQVELDRSIVKTDILGGCLVMEDDVAKYFEMQEALRKEHELKKRELLVFGKK